MRGTPEQVELAAWLVGQVDKTVYGPAEYPGGAGEVIRVLLVDVVQPQELTEISSALRTVADIRQLCTHPPDVVVVRGAERQTTVAEWLAGALRQLPDKTPVGSREYRFSAGGEDIVRVFYLPSGTTPRHLVELSTVLRTVGDILRASNYAGNSSLALRGTARQMALSEWILGELYSPSGAAAQEFRLPGEADDTVLLVHAERVASARELQELVLMVRRAAGLHTVFGLWETKAIVARGTAAQMASAAQLIKERDR